MLLISVFKGLGGGEGFGVLYKGGAVEVWGYAS